MRALEAIEGHLAQREGNRPLLPRRLAHHRRYLRLLADHRRAGLFQLRHEGHADRHAHLQPVHGNRRLRQSPSAQATRSKATLMKPIEVAVIGTGWCGGIRAETLAAHPLVKGLHLAEINAPRLAELARQDQSRRPRSRTTRAAQENGHRSGLHLGHARDHALPDRAGLPRRGQACVPREADRARARRSRRADRDRRKTRSSSSPSAIRSASTPSSPTCASASATAPSASR